MGTSRRKILSLGIIFVWNSSNAYPAGLSHSMIRSYHRIGNHLPIGLYAFSNLGGFVLSPRSKGIMLKRASSNDSSHGAAIRLFSANSKSSSGEQPQLFVYKGRTVQTALSESSTAFKSLGVSEPVLSSCHLLAHAMDLPWEGGFASLLRVSDGPLANKELSHRVLSAKESQRFAEMCRRRAEHEPLQYILGQWDFHTFRLKCRPPILCPRPETEELVEYAIRDIENRLRIQSEVRVLDVGCGTGCIGIALLHAFPKGKVHVVAMDISTQAVDLAEENADLVLGRKRSNYRVVLDSASRFHSETSFDIVVSNPPYIPLNDMEHLPKDVSEYEDRNALCGGSDGMDVMKEIIRRSSDWMKSDGGILWMEVDCSHPVKIRDFVENAMKCTRVRFVEYKPDFCGNDRFVKLEVHRDI